VCGSLSIRAIPDDLAGEYRPEYHALSASSRENGLVLGRIRRLRERQQAAGGSILGRLLAAAFPSNLEGFPDLLRSAGAEPDTRILDVGTGSGALLFHLRDGGYRDLTGLDPYLPVDETRKSGLRLLRTTAEELATGEDEREGFDLVMFNHSLEHAPDPEGSLRAARRLIAPGGRVLVRTPVVPCRAWERYGTAWVQLDAPRHLVIFSREGLPLMARRSGLELDGITDDSTEVQFLGSELYLERRPLQDLSWRYTWRERRRWRREARKLNARGEGDQAAFVFRAGEPETSR
jgi:2-polyprenyl-3-methyl-5-hydroxy-6-metoxy-1,4-benzoquinol methylase